VIRKFSNKKAPESTGAQFALLNTRKKLLSGGGLGGRGGKKPLRTMQTLRKLGETAVNQP